VYAGGDDRHASAAATILRDEDDRSLPERVSTAAWAILNGAQDAVMELLSEEWPLGPNGTVAEPGARVEGDRLVMWFGEESAPVIVLPPVVIAEILEGAA
jgi:hypothetical protein